MAKRIFFEALQFVPVIALASSFLVEGSVDLERAAALFVISGVGAAAITATESPASPDRQRAIRAAAVLTVCENKASGALTSRPPG